MTKPVAGAGNNSFLASSSIAQCGPCHSVGPSGSLGLGLTTFFWGVGGTDSSAEQGFTMAEVLNMSPEDRNANLSKLDMGGFGS